MEYKLCNEYGMINVRVHLLELILPKTSWIRGNKIAVSEFVFKNQWLGENSMSI